MTEIIAISEAAALAAIGVACAILAWKLAAVAPDLIAYGKAQVAAQLNQQQAENERDQEKAAREEAEAELVDTKQKLEAAEKALAACGQKVADVEGSKVAQAPDAHTALAIGVAELDQLSTGVPAAGSSGQAARGGARRETVAVPAAAAAKSTDGAGK